MLGVFATTSVIFILIGLGYFSVWKRIFSKDDLRVFGRYIVNFALPALVFRALTGSDLAAIIDFGYLAAYGTGSVAAFAIGYLVSWRLLGLTPLTASFQGMGMSCSNSGFIGFPILLMTLPSLAPTVLALNLTIENLLMIPIVLLCAERAVGSGGAKGWSLHGRIFLRLVFRNPIMVAILIGLVVAVLGLELPRVVTQPVELVASSSAALSLMVIGGTLHGLSLRSVDLGVLLVVVGKLAIFPLCVALALAGYAAAGLPTATPDLARAAILAAAVPSAGVYTIFAQRFGEQDRAALAMLVMTGISFFSISLAMAILDIGATVPG